LLRFDFRPSDQRELIRTRFCNDFYEDICTIPWDIAILEKNCDKGMMISFLHWTCEHYLSKKRKKGKRKSLNQYWRDFKMLYRRMNGCHVNGNDLAEVVKVFHYFVNVAYCLEADL
jgi:hypothetical protein